MDHVSLHSAFTDPVPLLNELPYTSTIAQSNDKQLQTVAKMPLLRENSMFRSNRSKSEVAEKLGC